MGVAGAADSVTRPSPLPPATRVARAFPAPALVITGILSVQVGAGLAGRMFGDVTPATMTGLRLWVSAAVVGAVGGRAVARSVREVVRDRAWRDMAVVLAFGVTLAVMNFSFYQSIARIPLGIAAAVEFLGPPGRPG